IAKVGGGFCWGGFSPLCHLCWLTHRIREQARFHIWIFSRLNFSGITKNLHATPRPTRKFFLVI
ncbi:hypothetical protein ACW9I8_30470, partial [Pseudomonas reactans]